MLTKEELIKSFKTIISEFKVEVDKALHNIQISDKQFNRNLSLDFVDGEYKKARAYFESKSYLLLREDYSPIMQQLEAIKESFDQQTQQFKETNVAYYSFIKSAAVTNLKNYLPTLEASGKKQLGSSDKYVIIKYLISDLENAKTIQNVHGIMQNFKANDYYNEIINEAQGSLSLLWTPAKTQTAKLVDALEKELEKYPLRRSGLVPK